MAGSVKGMITNDARNQLRTAEYERRRTSFPLSGTAAGITVMVSPARHPDSSLGAYDPMSDAEAVYDSMVNAATLIGAIPDASADGLVHGSIILRTTSMATLRFLIHQNRMQSDRSCRGSMGSMQPA